VLEARYVELDGYTVAFETHKAEFDPVLDKNMAAMKAAEL
jgi:hypothetical protein